MLGLLKMCTITYEENVFIIIIIPIVHMTKLRHKEFNLSAVRRAGYSKARI